MCFFASNEVDGISKNPEVCASQTLEDHKALCDKGHLDHL